MGTLHQDHGIAVQKLSTCRSPYSLRLQGAQSLMGMYLGLPWELRHRIHTFCVEGPYDNDVIVRGRGKTTPTLLVRQSTGPLSYNWSEDPTPKQVSPERVGLNASREILQMYYRNRTFQFVHDELESVKCFIETDCFGLAICPAEHLRRLHLQIQPFRYAQLRDSDLREDEEIKCREALQSLAALTSAKTAIGVHIDLAQGCADNEEREELLLDAAAFAFQLIQLVNTLTTNGLRIDVLIEGDWNGTGEIQICGGSISSMDDCVAQLRAAYQ